MCPVCHLATGAGAAAPGGVEAAGDVLGAAAAHLAGHGDVAAVSLGEGGLVVACCTGAVEAVAGRCGALGAAEAV